VLTQGIRHRTVEMLEKLLHLLATPRGKKKSETSEMEWDGIKDLHTCVSIDYVGDHILGLKQSHIG